MQEFMWWRPAPHQHRNTRATEFPLAHSQDAKWWTMLSIRSLCSNPWQKKTRATKNKPHIIYPGAARGYRKRSACRCNCHASFRPVFSKKISSRLLHIRMMMMMIVIHGALMVKSSDITIQNNCSFVTSTYETALKGYDQLIYTT